MIKLELDEILKLDKYYRISLINKISGLKSANLIGTQNNKGILNLAIFNSVINIGSNPPLLGFINRPLVVDRNTYSNIKETGYFTINQVNEQIHKNAHQTSAKFEKPESEFLQCELDEEFIDEFHAPFVKKSKIKIGLSYLEEHEIKVNNTILIVGKIEIIIIPESALKTDGDLDLENLNTVAIGGLDTYYSCKKIARYNYARTNKKTTIID